MNIVDLTNYENGRLRLFQTFNEKRKKYNLPQMN